VARVPPAESTALNEGSNPLVQRHVKEERNPGLCIKMSN